MTPARGWPELLGVADEIDLAGGFQLHELNASWEEGLGSFNPPREVQARFVGSAGSAAMSEGERFVALAFNHLESVGARTADLDILDFGAGWGRVARGLAQRTGPARLWCAELLPVARAYCSLGVPGASVVAVDVAPPTKLASDSFDLITAYSVFTHLPPALHASWAAELARLLRPGGTIVATYWDEWFLDLCEASHRGEVAGSTAWHDALATLFQPHDEHRSRLASSGHLFAGTGGGEGLEAATYGEAVVTRDHVASVWREHGLRLEAWDVSRTSTPQAVAVLRA